MTGDRLDICPWCNTRCIPGAIGGMEPVLDGLRWWHQGCVADADRAAREIAEVRDTTDDRWQVAFRKAEFYRVPDSYAPTTQRAADVTDALTKAVREDTP